MHPDDLKGSWKAQGAQTRVSIDADLLLKELRRNDRTFAATIFWRDFREVGVALVLVPVWIYLGLSSSLPWTWYLGVPAVLWIAGFMLVDRWLQNKRHPQQPDASLRQSIATSLAQVEHQIWLLRNIVWWYLLPPTISCLAFFAQCAWERRADGWGEALLGFATSAGFVFGLYAGVYWLNQYVVRATLVPRRQELEGLLAGLADETTAGSE